MAFATSSSAFGIKPTATNSVGTTPQAAGSNPSPFGAFGNQPAQPSASSSIFGGLGQNQTQTQGQSQTQPAQGGLFGQQQPVQQQQPGGSLFGQQPAQPQPSGGLFGQQPAQPQLSGSLFGQQPVQPQPSGSLFGQQPAQPQPSGGLFGQQPAQPQPGGGLFGQQPAQPQPSGSLFGQQPAQQHLQQPSGSLFGQQQPAQQQPQQPSGSQFGQQQPPQQQPQQASASLFGGGTWGSGSTNVNPLSQPAQSGFGTWPLGSSQAQNQPQQQQQQTGFGTSSSFGNTINQPQPGGLWGSSGASQSFLGQPASAQTQQQAAPFTRTTKFNDLPELAQKIFESVDTHIQGRIQISNDLKARSLGEEPIKGAELIRKVHNDLVNTMSNLEADKVVAEELKSKVDLSVQDTVITTRIIDGSRNPQQNGSYLKNHANFPLEYFSRAAEEIRQKLQWYKSTIEQIERRLSSAQNQAQYNPQAITTTLQAQNATFISLAAKTAELDAELQQIKSAYRSLWRAHTRSARDPFNEVDRRPDDSGGLLGGIGLTNTSMSR